jgi:hypothetical protein
MAAPITHIVLTDKIFQDVFGDKDKEKFFIGTCFPDIRYATSVGRDETHFKDANLTQIRKDGPFWAGLKFHSYLDQKRDEYLSETKLNSLIPESQQSDRAIKFFEDQLLYSKVKDWSEYLKYLSSIVEDQAIFGLQKKEIINWQKMLQRYFSNKPNNQSVRSFCLELGFEKKDIDEIERVILELKHDKEVEKIISKMYSDFDRIIKEDL